MRKSYQIYFRLLQNLLTREPEENWVKWYKLGIKNQFFTFQECSWFLQNPENAKLFDQDVDYTIKEIYSLTEVPQEEQLKQGL